MSQDRSHLCQSAVDVVELQVNLDDTTAEIIADAQDRLLQGGALDAWTVAITMKKNRPAVMLSVLCKAETQNELARLMIETTGSFGVRYRSWRRLVLDRRHEMVATRFGEVRIKVGQLDGRMVIAQPEFDDVKRLAQSAGVVVRQVMDAAKAEADRWLAEQQQGGSQ